MNLVDLIKELPSEIMHRSKNETSKLKKDSNEVKSSHTPDTTDNSMEGSPDEVYFAKERKHSESEV